MKVLSLGAGVQSTTLALMIARGDLPPVDCAIFADTGAEPSAVYKHLDWLGTVVPFPIHRVSAGNLRDEIFNAVTSGAHRLDARPPFFVTGGGMMQRQCTQDFKILPIIKKVRELIGLKKGHRGPRTPIVETLIGISCDEAIRMKPSRLSYIKHSWPLIERGMHRHHCLKWCEDRQYPKPVKSACTFCPYTDLTRWRDMKANDPESFADAVRVDRAIRNGLPGPKQPPGTQWFVHRSLKPPDEVDLSTAEDRGQLNLFVNECEGMCGV